ncbi:MAG TPA: hypothetical protein PKD23_02755 [Bellilinea sp.]|nr:hypothetical protein [Bellilinea sp.]
MEETLLTSTQERSLHASLLLFEKALRKVDRLLSDGDEIGILYYRKSYLDKQTRELIHKKIANTLVELEEFTKKLALRPIAESLESTIMGEMSISWESLEESRSKRMRGYGEISPQAVEIIDPAIDHFARIALGLSSIFTSEPSNNKSE